MASVPKHPLTISLMEFSDVKHPAQSLHCLGTEKWFGNQFLGLYSFANPMKDNSDVRCAPVSFIGVQETTSFYQLCFRGVLVVSSLCPTVCPGTRKTTTAPVPSASPKKDFPR